MELSSWGVFQEPKFIFRWIHFMSGIVWIGLLYYFNFVQGAFFGETDANTKKACIQKLVPRALWWFRWGAMFTFLSGWILILWEAHQDIEALSSSWGVAILTGAALGTLMWFNVWFVIWPNQKIVIASALGETLKGDPAAAGARALTASRTNVFFSIPLLFFMGAARHLPVAVSEESHFKALALILGIILLGVEFNALKGKPGPLTTVKGVIHSGIALTVLLYIIVEMTM